MTCIGRVILLGIALIVVAGCAVSPTRTETDYGRAYHAVRMRQMLPSEAGKTRPPEVGFDGQAARSTIDRYRQQLGRP